MNNYFNHIVGVLENIMKSEKHNIEQAAQLLADHIKKDKIFYIYGPGGHSNLASQEVFFRAGGLMHASAILDEGTLLSSGALRSMTMERTPGYGKIVMDDYQLKSEDLLIIVNAYGINSATIDAALEANKRNIKTISVSSIGHAKDTPKEHPARHPSQKNLHDLSDVSVDSKVEVGDAVLEIEGLEQKVGAISTFTNAFILNSICNEATNILAKQNIQPPIWKSGNATGGDEWNSQFINRFKGKIKNL